jgi:hypothetical protein
LCLKKLKYTKNISPSSFVAFVGSGIRDLGFGMDKDIIQGKHPGSATLAECCPAVINEIMLHFFVLINSE